jgi:hypothetical protein
MRPWGKELGTRNAAGVAGTYVEDVSGRVTPPHGMQPEPQQIAF